MHIQISNIQLKLQSLNNYSKFYSEIKLFNSTVEILI